ncbi:DUF7344 domain-containing protein [Halostella salina]|uniref:DUF7344 domain-containing protein n=1 Tax=Halostella salina TaxID=1547897 RepID=UPI000EF81398|nr:hypothetical protein [Halostella salina]
MTNEGRTSGGSDHQADPEAVDDAFELLASAERRAVLNYLREHGDATLAELADVVAGRRAAAEGTFVPPERRVRIRIELDHAQLPLLDDRGIVDYGRDRERVALDTLPEPVETLLDLARTVAGEGATPNYPATDRERTPGGDPR